MTTCGSKVTRRTILLRALLKPDAAAAVVLPPSQLLGGSTHRRTTMADSASESDTDGAGSSSATPMSSSASNSAKPSIVISQFRLEELTNRLASLQQENKVLKIELETFKLKCKALQEENRDLRKASVTIVSNVSPLTSSMLPPPPHVFWIVTAFVRKLALRGVTGFVPKSTTPSRFNVGK